MKLYLNFLFIVIGLVIAYNLYGIVTFQKDEPIPFVFNEPKLPPEIVEATEPKVDEAVSVAVTKTQNGLQTYNALSYSVPEQGKDTFNTLITKMREGDLPVYFITASDAANNNMRSFELLSFSTPLKPLSTTSCKGEPLNSFIIGTSETDRLICDVDRTAPDATTKADVLMIGGPGNDIIIDADGNRIVNGGTGDDQITLGGGRSIIVLDASWGHDTLSVKCVGANIDPTQIPEGFPIPWTSPTSNFIVLGQGIQPQDIEWRGNVLTHKVTGDTLTVNQNCFTVVPAI